MERYDMVCPEKPGLPGKDIFPNVYANDLKYHGCYATIISD